MSTKKKSKFHIIITPAPKKTINKKSRKPLSKLFFLDENANHTPEIEEHCPDHDDHIVVTSPDVSAVEASTSHSDSSIIIISDDSGCISQDTSLKVDEIPKSRRMIATHRTEVNKDFWDIDDSDEEAFIAIYVKKSPLSFTSASPQFVNFECVDELSRESATVSVQVERGFSVRSGGLLPGDGKVKKRRTVAQRKNEWRKHSSRFSL